MTPPSFGDSATCSSLTQTMFWPFTHIPIPSTIICNGGRRPSPLRNDTIVAAAEARVFARAGQHARRALPWPISFVAELSSRRLLRRSVERIQQPRKTVCFLLQMRRMKKSKRRTE